jgi:site-specific recombinase XerC
MLFDWLITGQVVPTNPAAAVRGPKHVVKIGKTPVLKRGERRKLIDAILTDTVRDLATAR